MAKTRFEEMLEEMDRIYGRPKPVPVTKAAKPKVEATVIKFPRTIEPSRYQEILDEAQEQYLRRQRELEEEYGQSCHRGPGDPDYWRR